MIKYFHKFLTNSSCKTNFLLIFSLTAPYSLTLYRKLTSNINYYFFKFIVQKFPFTKPYLSPVIKIFDSKQISEQDILNAQREWGNGIIHIGNVHSSGGDYHSAANDFVDHLYDEFPNVLFKPTKASQVPFRRTKMQTISYLVGGSIPEDSGFAITPFTHINWVSNGIIIHNKIALSMGHYYFKNASTGKFLKVEYTFAYIRCPFKDGLKIILHHSSIPYAHDDYYISHVQNMMSYFNI